MHPVSSIGTGARTWTALLAMTAMVVIATIPAAKAEDAKAMFKAMSDYMAAQKAISFKLDTNLDVVTADKQKLGIASSGTLILNRPDKVRATRTGGFSDIEMVYDGKMLTLVGKNANVYAQAQAPATIDLLVDELRDKYHRPVPAADLVMANPYEQLMPLVTDSRDLGSGVIHGVECNHLAFRTKDVDWQIWIAQGPNPYPCRYVITSTSTPGMPQYTIDITDWKAGSAVASDNFVAAIPANAKKLNPDELKDFDELGGIYSPKVEN
jgi:hypothetical protein